MIYAYLIAALCFAGLGAYARIEHSGKLEAEAQVQALGSKIEQQNAAVDQVKKDGDARVAAAQKGVQAAAAASVNARAEAVRLRGILSQATPQVNCPSATAVAEVRKGLGK